jgi:antitoxin VapB
MRRMGKVFITNRSQAVRLPKKFQFDAVEVFIRKVGDEVILSQRPVGMSHYLKTGPAAAVDFMESVEDIPARKL